jgi:hypothetical protein
LLRIATNAASARPQRERRAEQGALLRAEVADVTHVPLCERCRISRHVRRRLVLEVVYGAEERLNLRLGGVEAHLREHALHHFFSRSCKINKIRGIFIFNFNFYFLCSPNEDFPESTTADQSAGEANKRPRDVLLELQSSVIVGEVHMVMKAHSLTDFSSRRGKEDLPLVDISLQGRLKNSGTSICRADVHTRVGLLPRANRADFAKHRKFSKRRDR